MQNEIGVQDSGFSIFSGQFNFLKRKEEKKIPKINNNILSKKSQGYKCIQAHVTVTMPMSETNPATGKTKKQQNTQNVKIPTYIH